AKRPTYLPDSIDKNEIINFISNKSIQNDLNNEVSNLYALFDDWQKNNQGFHSLSRVMYPFKSPEKLLELEYEITHSIPELKHHPGELFHTIAHNLDLAYTKHTPCSINNATSNNRENLMDSISRADTKLAAAYKKIKKDNLKQISNDFYYLLSELSQLRTLISQTDPLASINAMNTSMLINYDELLAAATEFRCILNNKLDIEVKNSVVTVPVELKNSITGQVTKVVKSDQRWIVYGGGDNNSYDMSVIDVVYDQAGDDTYYFSKPDPVNLKLVIDKSGNDKYLSDDIGPAAGWFGLSILVDHAGNDYYQGKLAANATGMMGIGVLIDYAGKDIYAGDHFSNGAAYYGAGLLLDLGDEADQYQSATFSQGFGGPRGLGLIYDYNGNDLYHADGPMPSVYGTPAVHASFSQGIGFGLRHYDSGGIGIIYDQSGSDRYVGGEFSQAGGYYWGLGIIHDNEGNDNYNGNRYSQGFAAHQAIGILFDNKGNDHYQGMTAACQGAAWDVAIGLLVDKEGNDTYRGDGLCQGSAAMQAMGWLIDLDGTDHYIAGSESSQGHSANNTYHFDPKKPVYSWSMLIDTGGNNDFYSNKRENNQIIRFSEINKEKPAESHIHGLFIDTDQPLF
ncbi:MAG: hypothetical protein MI865_06610, partial [Proteobacteria bacterium]|nr:hypothetical protein [Pseudomonadota bacterium]